MPVSHRLTYHVHLPFFLTPMVDGVWAGGDNAASAYTTVHAAYAIFHPAVDGVSGGVRRDGTAKLAGRTR